MEMDSELPSTESKSDTKSLISSYEGAIFKIILRDLHNCLHRYIL